MYLYPSGESFIATFLVLAFMGFVIGGGSQYIANAMNGLEGGDRWEGVLGAAIGGAIVLPSILFPTNTIFLLAVLSGVTNGLVNEIERSIKYNQNFNFLSFAYDSLVYSLLNRVPFANSLTGHMIRTFLVDSVGYKIADRYKDDILSVYGKYGFRYRVSSSSSFCSENSYRVDFTKLLTPRMM